MREMVRRLIDEFNGTTINLGEKTLFRRTLYNIAGWLIKAAGKKMSRLKEDSELKAALKDIIAASNATSERDSLCEKLPTGKVDNMHTRIAGALYYASFRYVLLVEWVHFGCADLFHDSEFFLTLWMQICEHLLIEHLILILDQESPLISLRSWY